MLHLIHLLERRYGTQGASRVAMRLLLASALLLMLGLGLLLSGRGAQAVINVNTLRAPPAGLQPGKPVTHDGESGEARRARRVQTWTPVVGPV